MKITPLFDRVIVRPEGKENVTKSGIILPQTAQDKPEIGEVVAIGDGSNLDGDKVEMRVKVGDKVIFNKYIGSEVKIDGVTHIVVRQIDIIGVVND